MTVDSAAVAPATTWTTKYRSRAEISPNAIVQFKGSATRNWCLAILGRKVVKCAELCKEAVAEVAHPKQPLEGHSRIIFLGVGK